MFFFLCHFSLFGTKGRRIQFLFMQNPIKRNRNRSVKRQKLLQNRAPKNKVEIDSEKNDYSTAAGFHSKGWPLGHPAHLVQHLSEVNLNSPCVVVLTNFLDTELNCCTLGQSTGTLGSLQHLCLSWIFSCAPLSCM